MITESVQSLDFSKYGSLISGTADLSGVLCNYAYEMLNCRVFPAVEYEHDLFIEPSSGLAVLTVFDKTKDGNVCTKDFLLTKPIKINAHVVFELHALDANFCFYQFSRGVKKTHPEYSTDPYTHGKTGFEIERVVSALRRQETGGTRLKGDRHDFWQLLYIESGSLCCSTVWQEYLLTEGKILLIPPDEWHSVTVKSDTCFLSLAFYSGSFLSKETDCYILDCDPFSRSLFARILSECEKSDNYSANVVTNCLQLFLFTVERMGVSEKAEGESNASLRPFTNKFFEAAKQIVKDNIYERDLSVKFIAMQLNVSISCLYRVFKKNARENLHDYIQNAKLEEAYRLLREGNYTVLQVSDMLNYCSQSYFSTRFKEKYGVSPRSVLRK